MLSSGVPFSVPVVPSVPSAEDLECLHAREHARAKAAEARPRQRFRGRKTGQAPMHVWDALHGGGRNPRMARMAQMRKCRQSASRAMVRESVPGDADAQKDGQAGNENRSSPLDRTLTLCQAHGAMRATHCSSRVFYRCAREFFWFSTIFAAARKSSRLLFRLDLNGARGRNRTTDTRIFSPLLYP